MTNLKLIKIKSSNSTTVVAKFNLNLNTMLNTGNVIITANLPSIPNPEIFNVNVIQNIIILTTQPLTPYALYTVTFQSTSSIKFQSQDGLSHLLQMELSILEPF